jgi:hypothetical protein
MSTTAQRPNFDIKSDLFMVQTRDYPLADTTLLDPRLSTCSLARIALNVAASSARRPRSTVRSLTGAMRRSAE